MSGPQPFQLRHPRGGRAASWFGKPSGVEAMAAAERLASMPARKPTDFRPTVGVRAGAGARAGELGPAAGAGAGAGAGVGASSASALSKSMTAFDTSFAFSYTRPRQK